LLQVTEAIPSNSSLQVAYLIYAGETELPIIPSFVSAEVPVTVPASLAGGDWHFKVTATNGAGLLDFPGLIEINSGLYAFPDPVALSSDFGVSDGYFSLTDDAGYPTDGYIVIESEILQYSSLSGGVASVVARGLYGTSLVPHLSGSTAALWTGVEAVSADLTSIPSCGLERPKWVDARKVGLEQAIDFGDGSTVGLKWDYATVPLGFSGTYYQVYKSIDLKALYSSPLFITAANEATLTGVSPKDGHYYGVRATYFLADFTTNGMSEPSTGLFQIPSPAELVDNLMQGALGSVQVTSTAGYPSSGLLRVNHEIMKYSSLTPTAFVISARDVFALAWTEDIPAGSKVEMFYGVDDATPYFWRLNTSWDGYGLAALPLEPGDGYWGFQYLQDPDGYRNFPVAIQNEDHSVQDADAEAADPFDYCGLRSNDQSQVLSGDFCGPKTPHGSGTYHGNSMLGQAGGIDVYEGNLQRQDILLGITGEPFVLLRRKWTGKVCPRISHRTEHPEARCSLCFAQGTLVRTESGYKPIESILVGEKVLTSDGKFRPVLKTFATPYSGDMIKVQSSIMASPVLATPEHPFFALRGEHRFSRPGGCGPVCDIYINDGDTPKTCGGVQMLPSGNWQARIQQFNSKRLSLGTYSTKEEAEAALADHRSENCAHDFEWTQAEDLSKKDWLVATWPQMADNEEEFIDIPVKYHGRTGNAHKERLGARRIRIDEEFCWIIGMYIAEGSGTITNESCSNGGGRIAFSLHKKETAYANRIMDFFKNLGLKSRIVKSKTNQGMAVTIASSMIAEWFRDWLGHYCNNKKIPEELMHVSHSKTWALISGVYDGDGSRRENEISQTSEVLALQLVELLHRVGEQPLLRRLIPKAKTPKGNDRKIVYSVNWAEPGFPKDRHRKNRWQYGGKKLSKVRSVGKEGYDGLVYNLHVEEDHTYVVQGILVHNCMGTSFEGGYDRYINTRRLRPAEENPNGFVNMRVSPYADELDLVDSRGFSTEKTDITAWTTANPTVRDRDILIRYIFDYETGIMREEFRYEVLTVRRNRLALGKDGAQHLTLKRLNPTEEIYKYVVNIL
jgi:hypothetical protein